MVREAARAGRFLSYGEIAEAQGLDWSKVRYPMNEHLWSLVKYAHSHGWPMLSAIIVNKDHRDTGDMDPSTLAGFVAAARQLGYEVVDPEGFLRDQQRRCFEWGQAERLDPYRGAT